MQEKRVRTLDEINNTSALLSRSGTGITGYVVGNPQVNFFKEVNALIAQYEGGGGMINAAGSAVSGLYSVASSYTGMDIAGWGFKPGDIITYLNSDLGQKFLAINGPQLLDMALNKEAKINFLGMEANIYDTFIKAYIDKPAQDFFETRAYSFWQHKKVIGAYSGSEPSESLKSEFKSFMKQQVDVKYTCNQFIVASVLSLNEIIGPDKLDMVMKELNYVVANALAQTEYYGKVEEKAQIVKDAVDIYTKNFKSMHPDININFLGVDSTTCQEFIEKIESTGTKNFDNITEDERRAEKIGDDFKTYSTPMDVNFICKQILPLVPGILANIDVNDNDTLTKISNIIEDVIADPMKFGTIATFGAISVGQSQINASMPSFRRGAIGGGQGHDISAYQLHNAQENTLAILNYVKNRTGEKHNIILSKLQGLLPAIIPILKNPNSLPIVQNLVENILSSRPDSMRFVYKNIIDLLNDPANSTALRENPESLNILTKVIMDIIESSLVTNNYSETAKNSSLLGFLMNDKHNDKKSLLQIVEPLLNRVLTAVVQDDPEAGFLRSSLLSVLQTLNISEIDGTSSLVSNHNLNQSQIDSLALKINSMDPADISYLQQHGGGGADCPSNVSDFMNYIKKENINATSSDIKAITTLLLQKANMQGKATATLLKGIKGIVGNKVLQKQCEETIKGQTQSPLAAISVILQNISNLPETNATLSGGFHAIFSTNEIKAAINRLDDSELIPLRDLIKYNSDFIKETIKQAAGGTIQAKLLMHTVIMPALCAIDADLATAIQGLEPTLFNKARVATVTFMTGGALTTGVGVVGATFGTVGAFLTSGAKGAKDFGSRVKNFITGTGKSPKSSPKAKTPQFGNSIGVDPLSSDNFAKIDGGGHNKTFSRSSTNSPSSIASFRGGGDENKHPNIGPGSGHR